MLEALSTEVQRFVSQVAKACQATETQVLEMMALSFMAERRAQVVEGLAASELATFPREADGTLMQGRDCYQYAAIQHRMRLQRIKAAEAQLARMTEGLDVIFRMVRQLSTFFLYTWPRMRGKLEAMNLAVPSLLGNEIDDMQANSLLADKIASEVEKMRIVA